MRTATVPLAAALFAPLALVGAYVCDYRGTGSQSIFPTFITLPVTCTIATDVFCNDNYYSDCTVNTNTQCTGPWSSRIQQAYAQSTCCQCAPTDPDAYDWCTTTAPSWDPSTEGLPSANYTIWSTQGCDAYRPDIFYDSSAAQPYTPGEWFTDNQQLVNYITNTVKCEDDCDVGQIQQQYPTEQVCTGGDALPGCCGYQVVYDCANTAISLSAKDACGNTNALGPYFVRYDDQVPSVAVTVPDLSTFKYKYKWEKLNVGVTITDDCDPNPLTSITVYSDEASLSHDHPEEAAVLTRNYANPTSVNATLNGWDVTLWRFKSAAKLCDAVDFSCLAANGRFYVVRVCAQDAAGNVNCAEDTIGVPPKSYSSAPKKVWSPVYDGKLFVVAKDLAYWNEPPTEFPPRPLNTGLDAQEE